jgi:hypothetical protein
MHIPVRALHDLSVPHSHSGRITIAEAMLIVNQEHHGACACRDRAMNDRKATGMFSQAGRLLACIMHLIACRTVLMIIC